MFYIFQNINITINKMGWFDKKEEKKMFAEQVVSLPQLPQLPRLPELPSMNNLSTLDRSVMPQLPSYPNNSLGQKFSQNAIKDAVTGEEEEQADFDADESLDEDEMMQKPRAKMSTREVLSKGTGFTSQRIASRTRKNEPVFVRMDKFEESTETFEDIKNKIMEIEKMLSDIKKIKEDEEKELQEWEHEIQSIKGQFEKIDRDLFSKVY